MRLSDKTRVEEHIFENHTLDLANNELKKLLEKRFGSCSGSEVIKIIFKLNSAPGYKITVAAGTLRFEAKTELEVLYAVYDFAEEWLDYCFYEPGKDWIAPDAGTSVDLPEGEILHSRPALLKRCGFIQEFPFSDDSYQIADWMVKNKLNYVMTWMKYYDRMSPALKEYYRIRGIEVESGHHNFDYWIPFDKYYKEHPDFFAVVNGKRIKPRKDESDLLLSKQICTTNPELRREIVKNIVEYCRKNPEVKTVSLIPNDGFGWCECESCSAFYDKADKGELYSVSRHVYRASRIYHDLFDYVSAELRKVLPDVNITFAAYVNYSRPAAGFQLKKNSAVHFAPYWRCINHRINAPDCPVNSEYAADLDRWLAAKNGGEVNIYEYYMGVNLYISLPMVHFEDIFDEMTWYGKRGVDGVLTQFHVPHWSVYGMNYYMMAKAARGTDKASEVDKMFKKLFGAQAGLARELFAKLKKLTLSAGKCHIPYPYSLLSRTRLEQYREIRETAASLNAQAPNNSLCRDYVIWTEYLYRFKELFDQYHSTGITVQEINDFRAWIKSQQAGSRVFVTAKADMVFDVWIKCIETGREWVHFNIDWEDAYIKEHAAGILAAARE